MKKYFVRYLAAIILLPVAITAWATSADITGKYAPGSGASYDVKVGEKIEMTGHCGTKFTEGVAGIEWTINGEVTKYHGKVGQTIHSFIVKGEAGEKFGAKLQCMTDSLLYKNDSAARWFTIVDGTPPQVAWDPYNATYARDSIAIKTLVNDFDSGIKQVWIRWSVSGDWSSGIEISDFVGNQKAADFSHTIDTSQMPPGKKEVQIWASDQNDNDTGWVTKGSFTVDHTAPLINWDNTNAQYARKKIVIKMEVSDSGSGVENVWIWWPGASSANIKMEREYGNHYKYTIDTSQLENGGKEVQIRAGDHAGNQTGWQTKGQFIVDYKPPEVIWNDKNIKYTNGDITLKANIVDSVSGILRVDLEWGIPGQPYIAGRMQAGTDNEYSFSIDTKNHPEGKRDVYLRATDKAGNSTSLSWYGSFVIDRTAPTIDWLEPQAQALMSHGHISVTGNMSDDNPEYVMIEWREEDASAWQSHRVSVDSSHRDFRYDLYGLAENINYQVRLRAGDKAGNISTVTPSRTVIGQSPARDLFPDAKLTIRKNSLSDKDNSGDYSKGDSFIYRLKILTGKFPAHDLSLRYALPSGLAITPGTRPKLIIINHSTDNRKLNASWNGSNNTELLADGIGLPANRILIIHIPVTIDAQHTTPIVSTVELRAKNAEDSLLLEHKLTLQDQYPADAALRLRLESMQTDWKYSRGTTFDYRISVRALQWPLSGIALHYTLPPGLERNGDVRIDGDGAAAIKLNAKWGKGLDNLLLSSAHNAWLIARHAFIITIPVRVGNMAIAGSFIESAVQASASNLKQEIVVTHRITVDGPPAMETQLLLKKTVDKKAALPGDKLLYTITFTNVSSENLSNLVIRDSIQSAYLTLRNTQCSSASMPNTLKCCVSSELNAQCGRAFKSEPGALEWHLDGTLAAGESGSVSYEAQVNQQ